jgi:protein arginine N-methyltransferase 1
MPPRRGARGGAAVAAGQDGAASLERRVANESLLATETEREATSASLYNDHKARISSNLASVRDRVRNSAYASATSNSFPGKTVLHIGCGMGLHAMMAARGGAKLVVGVDSSSIVHTATELAKQNNLTNIHFVQGRFTADDTAKPIGEPVDAAEKEKQVAAQQAIRDHKPPVLPLDKFDVIFCEWMGSFITNDEHFAEFEYAVKHHLAPGGIVCPDRAQLHAVGLSDFNYRSEMLDYWDNVYGFSMRPMRPLVLHEATTGHIPRECIATKPSPVHHVDLSRSKLQALLASPDATAVSVALDSLRRYTADFKLTVGSKCTMHFITFYLSASFTDAEHPRGNFILPFALGERNSFTEVSLMLPTPIPVFQNDVISGTLQVNPVKHQHTELLLTVRCNNAAIPNWETTEKYLFQY